MMIRQDIPSFGIDYDTGTGAGNFLRTATATTIRESEEAPKSVILKRITACHGLANANINDCG